MSIPKSFRYQNEADFIHRLLIPILQRLGFNNVTNYHGIREFGKDIVFEEIDRFGHDIYHGLQAKYVANIPQSEAFSLIDDAKQAFTVPFQHPINGNVERISKFYVVNGGSITDNVRDLFFNALRPQYGANVRLIDGNEIVSLERRAYLVFEPSAKFLTQLLRELSINRAAMIQLSNSTRSVDAYSALMLRDDCSTEYLKNPCFEIELDHGRIAEYSNLIREICRKKSTVDAVFIPEELRMSVYVQIETLTKAMVTIGEDLDQRIREVLAGIGPLLEP